MNKKNEILGIIGLRSGSRGVVNKNIRLLNGIPLAAHIIKKAKKSKYITRLIVSTDSEEYATVARSYGAETPFLRPTELAQDKSPELEYIKHALNWLKIHENYWPDIVIRMMATVPLQKTEDLDACIEQLIYNSYAQSAVVIAEARQHPLKALKIIKNEKGEKSLVTYFTESGREVTPIARQNYQAAYFRSNVIAFRPKVIEETDSITGDRVKFHIIPQERAIDIDSPIDFLIAELLIKKYEKDV